VAGLNLGGGKSVILGDNRTANRELIFRAHGRFVESLGGRYVTAEDVGTSTADMDFVHMETKFRRVLLSPAIRPRSRPTASSRDQASAFERWGSDSLRRTGDPGTRPCRHHLANEPPGGREADRHHMTRAGRLAVR
jgi:leucine dehydrogenase